MYLFRERRDTLHGGMVHSMQYLYNDSEVWTNLKTLLWRTFHLCSFQRLLQSITDVERDCAYRQSLAGRVIRDGGVNLILYSVVNEGFVTLSISEVFVAMSYFQLPVLLFSRCRAHSRAD